MIIDLTEKDIEKATIIAKDMLEIKRKLCTDMNYKAIDTSKSPFDRVFEGTLGEIDRSYILGPII